MKPLQSWANTYVDNSEKQQAFLVRHALGFLNMPASEVVIMSPAYDLTGVFALVFIGSAVSDSRGHMYRQQLNMLDNYDMA